MTFHNGGKDSNDNIPRLPRGWCPEYCVLETMDQSYSQINLLPETYPWIMKFRDNTSIVFKDYNEHHNFIQKTFNPNKP